MRAAVPIHSSKRKGFEEAADHVRISRERRKSEMKSVVAKAASPICEGMLVMGTGTTKRYTTPVHVSSSS